jgi:hypothetical protein
MMKKIIHDKLTESITLDSLVFKRLVVPGIFIEVLLAMIMCIPTGLNVNLLTRPIGGPPGIAIQAGMLPCTILMLAYFSVAFVYTIVLPYKYFKGSSSFLDSIRRFSIFSLLVLLQLDLMAIFGWIEFIRWNYMDILNIPVAGGLTLLGFIMAGVFLYWSIKICRQQKIRFFSLKTLEAVAILVGSLVLIVCTLLMII